MQHLFDVYDTFYQINGLIVDVDKMKMMAIKAVKPRHYPIFTHKGEPIQLMQSFKYLDVNFPLTNRWNVFHDSRLQAGWNRYYMFENQCNQSDTRW